MRPRTAAVGLVLVAEALLSLLSLGVGVGLFALTVILLLTAYTFRSASPPWAAGSAPPSPRNASRSRRKDR